MDATQHFEVSFTSSKSFSMRVEADVHPPWIPIRLRIVQRTPSPVGGSTSLEDDEQQIAVRESYATESRVLLLADEIDAGDYIFIVTTRMKRSSGPKMSRERCAHVTLTSAS